MKDLNKIVEGENAPVNQNDSKKEITKPTVIKQPEAVNKRRTAPKETVPDTVAVDATEETKPVSKKAAKAEVKNETKELSKKKKTVGEIVVPKEADSKEEQEKPDSGKKKIKVIKKNAKKAEEKVDKLKKKVKKAKKKDVKKSKLKGIKEKLDKAVDKLKSNVKKLKEAKKE